jgi:CRISPR-associated protein (TIGR03984 family)
MTQNSNKPNGLKYSKMKTTSTAFEVSSDAEILKNAPTENAWFIAYLFDCVVIGKVVDKRFVYYKQEDKKDVALSNIQKLRVFNKDAELFIWRTNQGKYKARLRKDGEGEAQGVVDANQVLFGTKAEILDQKYSILKEDRGTEIILSLKDLGISDSEINDGKGRLCIHTCSYIGYIEDTQATYEDVRFVEFVMYKEGEL